MDCTILAEDFPDKTSNLGWKSALHEHWDDSTEQFWTLKEKLNLLLLPAIELRRVAAEKKTCGSMACVLGLRAVYLQANTQARELAKSQVVVQSNIHNLPEC
jgi:hypothetical protein